MDAIDQLLQEAKPLYLAKKKQKKQALAAFGALSVAMLVICVFSPQKINEDRLYNYCTALYENVPCLPELPEAFNAYDYYEA